MIVLEVTYQVLRTVGSRSGNSRVESRLNGLQVKIMEDTAWCGAHNDNEMVVRCEPLQKLGNVQ
jgi:hypothetical protein